MSPSLSVPLSIQKEMSLNLSFRIRLRRIQPATSSLLFQPVTGDPLFPSRNNCKRVLLTELFVGDENEVLGIPMYASGFISIPSSISAKTPSFAEASSYSSKIWEIT
jgi:hypothetical protein